MLALLLWCTAWCGVPLQAYDVTAPVQFSKAPNTPETHWYHFLVGRDPANPQGYLKAKAKNGTMQAAAEFTATTDESNVWCLVLAGKDVNTDPNTLTTQNNVEVKLYNKGLQKYLNLDSGEWGIFDNDGRLFVVQDNFTGANFEMLFVDVKTQKRLSCRNNNEWIGLAMVKPNVFGHGTGRVFTQTAIPLSEPEWLDIIPLLNAENKIGGFTPGQLSALKTAVKDAQEKPYQTETYDGSGVYYWVNAGYFEILRGEVNKLKQVTADQKIQYADGYYRIKNASRAFYDLDTQTSKNPVMYANGTDAQWRLSTNATDEVWQVKKNADGTYTIKNHSTGNYFTTANDPELSATSTAGNLIPMNQQPYPGHYAINFGGTIAHAGGHDNGTGTTGDILNYTYGGETNLFATTSGTNYDQPSAWLFERTDAPGEPLSEQDKIDVRRLIWGSGKAGGIPEADITTLKTLWGDGNVTDQATINELRAEKNRLLAFSEGQRVPFTSGYYRIKNGDDGFNEQNKTARLYNNSADKTPKWTAGTVTNSNDAIYYILSKGDHKYEMIPITTGEYYNGAGVPSVKTGQKAMEISPVNLDKYAGYFKIISPDGSGTYPIGNSAHAVDHQHGNGSGGTTTNYSRGDGQDGNPEAARFNFFLPDNSAFNGASTWMFERTTDQDIPTLTGEETQKVQAVLNAKEVVNGFTAAQLAEFERLEDIHEEIGGKGIAPALVAEVNRLLLPAEPRIPYADGFYIIKNADYRFYERKTGGVLIMNANAETNNISRVTWKKQDAAITGQNPYEVWHVVRTPNTDLYTLTNLGSLTKLQGFDFISKTPRVESVPAALASKDAQIKLTFRDTATYPAQLLIQTNNGSTDANAITANPEGQGPDMTGNQVGPVLTWLANDPNNKADWDGTSLWMLRPVKEETITSLNDWQQKVKNYFERSENRYGGYTTKQLEKLKAITSNPYELLKEINALRATNRIAVADGFVRVYSAAEAYSQKGKEKNIYLKYNLDNNATTGTTMNGGPAWQPYNSTSVDQIWTIAKTGSGHSLQSPNNKKFVKDAGGALESTATEGLVKAIDENLFPGVYELGYSGQTLSLLGHSLGSGTEGSMTNARQATDGTPSFAWANSATETDNIIEYSTFYLDPAKTIELTPKPTAQWVTFCYPFAVKMPEAFATADAANGVWACIEQDAAANKPEVILVKPMQGQYVAKEVPMLMQMGPAKNLVMEIVSDDVATANSAITVKSRFWKGTLAPQKIKQGDFVMRNITEGNGWYPITNTSALILAANKVYLPSENAPASMKRFFGMMFDEGAITGIGGVTTDSADAQDSSIYYDLSGRRVAKPTKGIYINEKGKKVVFK